MAEKQNTDAKPTKNANEEKWKENGLIVKEDLRHLGFRSSRNQINCHFNKIKFFSLQT